MKSNPILEQVVRLGEQWNSAVKDTPDTRIYCWLGCSTQEQKMVNAFVMLNMSDQSNLNDIFLMSQETFKTSTTYGKSIVDMIGAYIDTWNQDEKLTETTGKIKWATTFDSKNTDAQNFVFSINNLADSLSCDDDTKLIVALLPKSIENLAEFQNWVDELLQNKIDKRVRFMLYDSYNSRLFNSLSQKYIFLFKYIQPDIDLNGAIDQVLENAKQETKDEASQDTISYQQLIVRMNEAIGYRKESDVLKYGMQAVELAKKNKFTHLEAIVYYFFHAFYTAVNKELKAEESIDNAIKYAKQSIDENIEGGRMACVQYLIIKANTYFFQNKYKYAITYYSEALSINNQEPDINIQINLYQMLGICKRKRGETDDAWDYFVKGWELIEKMDKGYLIENQQFMYYADEMLKVKSIYEYIKIFEELWGENWQAAIKNQYEERKKSLKVLK